MSRVKSGTGRWHELAKLLPVLNAAGFDGLFIEQETGVTRATQTKWTDSMQVRAPASALALHSPLSVTAHHREPEQACALQLCWHQIRAWFSVLA